MELKAYQNTVLKEVDAYLEAVAEQQAQSNTRHAAQDAWDKLGISPCYREQRTGANSDLPVFCLKVPTGGGKTLLATQVVGLACKRLVPQRSGAGLVLWVVPSDQIYKDTLKALRDRSHFYRESLEYALGQRIEVWEKHEIARMTPAQLKTCMNVLIIKLQGARRQDTQYLKFFKDSGGNITQHFPPEDDSEGHRLLKERVPNMDMLVADVQTGSYLAKTSVGNLVRLCEPIVILDEGHKATSQLAQDTIRGFNPCLVVELSATPPCEANVLSRVSGMQLLKEQMIKLPINVVTSRETSWTNCLTRARELRETLAARAHEYAAQGNRLIRPIVLVQVERTGKDQRDTGFIHSEDVREWLVGHLGVDWNCVAVKSSDKDDIEGLDLMDDNCRVEWIITKSALQEGWDCPYAYILVSLSNTRSKQSMTQLVGRVLRQPFATKTPFSELNESYVYCLRTSTEEVIAEIRTSLSKEGYEGDAASVVDATHDNPPPDERIAAMRLEFARQYVKPFEGRIFLPRFCLRRPEGDEPLDYYSHLLNQVEVRKFDYKNVLDWDMTFDVSSAKEHFRSITLNDEALEPTETGARSLLLIDDDAQIKSWLIANLGDSRFSAKQLRYVVEQVCARLQGVTGQLAYIRFHLLNKIEGLIQRETNAQTQTAFEFLYDENSLFFGLACIECTFELPPSVKRKRLRALLRRDNTSVEKTLFDFEPDDINDYEKDVALYLDQRPEVLWWYRNLVGREEFSIEGWQPNKLYSDFIVQRGVDGAAQPMVWIIESKGRQLSGNTDTKYKRNVARVFEELGRKVTWQELGAGFAEHCFRFQVLDQGDYADKDWRDDLHRMLIASLVP